jgi:hypothetical protein
MSIGVTEEAIPKHRLEQKKTINEEWMVIVVLGGPLQADLSPGHWLKARLITAIQLYAKNRKQGKPSKLVCTGGDVPGHGKSEAQAMMEYAMSKGVPSCHILTDKEAKDSIQNAIFVAPLLIRLGVRNVTVITSSFHIPRMKHYFSSILRAYDEKGEIFSLSYAGADDGYTDEERKGRIRKEELLIVRSQPLLNQAIEKIHYDAHSSVRGRRAWSMCNINLEDLSQVEAPPRPMQRAATQLSFDTKASPVADEAPSSIKEAQAEEDPSSIRRSFSVNTFLTTKPPKPPPPVLSFVPDGEPAKKGYASAIDPSAIDPSAIDPSAIDPSAIDPPAIDPSAIDLSAIDPPAIDPSAIAPPHASCCADS